MTGVLGRRVLHGRAQAAEGELRAPRTWNVPGGEGPLPSPLRSVAQTVPLSLPLRCNLDILKLPPLWDFFFF